MMKGNEKVQREAKLRGFIDQQGRKVNYIHPRDVEGLPRGTENGKVPQTQTWEDS